MFGSPRNRLLLLLVCAIIGVLLVALWNGELPGFGRESDRIERLRTVAESGSRLSGENQSRVLWVGEPPANLPEIGRAPPEVVSVLEGADMVAAVEALQAALGAGRRIGVSLTQGTPATADSLRAALERREFVAGLRGVLHETNYSIYEVRKPDPDGTTERAAMAGVCRGVLEGATPPAATKFPASLQVSAPVEILVMIKEGRKARLWRSARGSSIARALLTACGAARTRWMEREAAMGESLHTALKRMGVHVFLLLDDGTLGERSDRFADAVVTKRHGVGYERRSNWRYDLPGDVRNAGGGAAGFRALFSRNGLPAESLGREGIRPYRLALVSLAESPAGTAPDATSENGAGASGSDME